MRQARCQKRVRQGVFCTAAVRTRTLVLGSVATKVVRLAGVPVTLVK